MRQQLLPAEVGQEHHHHEVRDAFKKIKQQAAGFGGNVDLSTSGYNLILTYLCRWHASIYRLIWIDVLVWLLLYYALNLVYRLLLSDEQKLGFENFVEAVGEWEGKIPVTFLLGFFVSNVVSRWWNIFGTIPRMSGTAHTLVSTINSSSSSSSRSRSSQQQQRVAAEAAQYRLTIGRYLNLAWVLALTKICGGLKDRFHIVETLTRKFGYKVEVSEEGVVSFGMDDTDGGVDELQELMQRCMSDDADAKYRSLKPLAIVNSDPTVRQHFGHLITREEMEVFLLRAEAVGPAYQLEWLLPIYWALALSQRALEKGLVKDSVMLLKLQAEIRSWAAKIRLLLNFAKRHLPLVYTQVAIIAVYTIYFTDAISRQLLLDNKIALKRRARGYYVDYFFPVLAIVHVVFIIGWFKVALVLIDPFGNDDEDFPFSAIFNGNLKVVVTHCGSNDTWYPKKVAPAGDGPESDDEALGELRQAVEEAAKRRRQQYGTFASD